MKYYLVTFKVIKFKVENNIPKKKVNNSKNNINIRLNYYINKIIFLLFNTF